MNETLTFAGINSGTYGVYIAGDNVYNAPERDVEMITVPGRNGNLSIDGGRFENIEITYPAFMFRTNQADFASDLADFRSAILSKKGYQRLTDDYNAGEFRWAVYKSGLEVDPKIYNRAGEFELTFDCKPQRFLTSGETAVTFTASGSITNPTDFESKPLIRIWGAGIVTMNGYAITITTGNANGIYIDFDTFEAYSIAGSTVISQNGNVAIGNQAPELSPGANSVSLGSGITKVEIIPRWYIV